MLLTLYVALGLIALIALGTALRAASSVLACLLAPCRLARWLCYRRDPTVVYVTDGDFAEFV